MSDGMTPNIPDVCSPKIKMRAGLDELSHIATRLARIGEQFNDVVVESTDEVTKWKSRVAELEARQSTGDRSATGRKSRQNSAERKLKLVRQTMLGLLKELGSDETVSPNLGRSPGRTPCSERSVLSPGRFHRPPHIPKTTFNVDDNWTMSTSRAPKSAEVVCPVSWEHLATTLALDENTLCSLETLSLMDDLCFRIHIIRDMAFIYEPVAVDGPSTSILFDWGAPADHQGTVAYIQANMPENNIFHIFILPSKKEAGQTLWYYIGAYVWTLVPQIPVWESLSDKGKRIIVKRLKKRCNGKLSERDVRHMVETGELQLFCIEISGKSCVDMSKAFAANRLHYVNLRSSNAQS